MSQARLAPAESKGARWNGQYADPENQAAFLEMVRKRRSGLRGEQLKPHPPITEAADVPDNHYRDGMTADRAVEELHRLASNEKPFMLAVGFVKPHLPFCAPKKYWDLYAEDDMELAPNPDFPAGMPEIAFANHPNFYDYAYGEYAPLRNDEAMDDRSAKHLRHAYRAAVSFVDAQVGRLLDTLQELELEDDTIVVLWGDHGFQLGDSGQWGKQTNFEWAARSPLIVRVPGMPHAGAKSEALVETIDIFPTVLDLCGLPPLAVFDGRSMVPLLSEPDLNWKEAAYHVFDRNSYDTMGVGDEKQAVIGHAVRTHRYRYVTWRKGWSLDGAEVGVELYDYADSPWEQRNLAADPAYGTIRDYLERLVELGPAGRFN